MINVTHLRYEVLRTLRNPAYLLLVIGLPLILFYAIGSANRNAHADGTTFLLYFMTSMAVYGAMYAVVAPGSRTAQDRARGWTRQMRITPLRARSDVLAKVLCAYLVALPTLIVVYLAGISLGVRLSAGQWGEITGLILVGLAPLVAMGILFGYLIRPDTTAVVFGGSVVILALLGGEFGTFFNSGAMLDVVKLLPSYWLAQAGKAAILGVNWPLEAWVVVGAWTLGMILLATWAYRRMAARI